MAKVRRLRKKLHNQSGRTPLTKSKALEQSARMMDGEKIPLVAVWAPDANGKCLCHKGDDCNSPGKHPLTKYCPRGYRTPLSDLDTVLDLISHKQRINLAAVMSNSSCVLAIDIDPRHGGDETIKIVEKKYGTLPETVEHITSQGGRHLLFRYKGNLNLRSGAGKFGSGVDVIANGMVMLPGSTHSSGYQYRYREGHSPNQRPIAELPANYMEFLRDDSTEIGKETGDRGGLISKGERNQKVMSFAGQLRRQGMSFKQIHQLLKVYNQQCCADPLSNKEVRSISQSVCRYTPDSQLPLAPQAPFPLHLFPKWLAKFLTTAAEAMGCDVAMIAPHVLAVAAAAIGNSRRILLKNAWSEPAVVWIFVVAESGTLKSPGHELALYPVVVHQEAAKIKYRKKFDLWKQLAPEEQHSTPKPRMKRYQISDATIEAVMSILNHQPRGVLLARDEIAGFIEAMNAYSSSGKGDESVWLSIFRAGAHSVDRKTGDELTIMIKHAAVSVCGSIQPGILKKLSTASRIDSGLFPRILLVYPDSKAKVWTETDIDEGAMQTYAQRMNRLYKLLPAGVDDDGSYRPKEIPLTTDAKEVWRTFYNAHNAEAIGYSGEMAARWAKLEAYAARFALIFEHLEWAFGPAKKQQPAEISSRSMEAGVELYRWFANETKRVLGHMAADSEAGVQAHAIEQVRGLGGSTTARDLARSSSRYEPTKRASEVLDALVAAGRGEWVRSQATKRGGRPTQKFVLKD